MTHTVIHRSDTRGHADHGWLVANHSFSFADYFNRERMGFGVLRVLNDDTIAVGEGFGTHPHANMEIITIPLEGELAHKDSMGNGTTIKSGDIQVMSAGTGIRHSEYNPSTENKTKLLQIWIIPKVQNVTPRYDQITLDSHQKNKLIQIVSPEKNDAGTWIHQDAWFHIGTFDTGTSSSYALKKDGNGLYIFVISGSIQIGEEILDTRDAIGIWDTNNIDIQILSESRFLIMEVPMGM